MIAIVDYGMGNLWSVESALDYLGYKSCIASDPKKIINASNAIRRQASERAAINAPVQGTAADIMKIAMIKMHKSIKKEGVEAKLILQVHDELILDTPKKEIDTVVGLITDSMMGAANLDVPLEIDIGIGDNWDQAH